MTAAVDPPITTGSLGPLGNRLVNAVFRWYMPTGQRDRCAGCSGWAAELAETVPGQEQGKGEVDRGLVRLDDSVAAPRLPVGLEFVIVTVTCVFSEQPGHVRQRRVLARESHFRRP